MGPERLKQIEELYHAALEQPIALRDSFLSNSCGDDDDLRREVESLLLFDKDFDSFIDTPPEALAAEIISDKEKLTSLVNQEIGHYKIEKLLGKGGMGHVYLAKDTELERYVALKILPSDFASDSERFRRFNREAKFVSALNHPNILTIHEIGSFEGARFIASEYVKGKTLREKLGQGAFKLDKALDIAIQIAAALEAAHAEKIVHRDIKPENIMLRDDGLIKVLDFGIAKLLDKETPDTLDTEAKTMPQFQTRVGMVLGTVSYMSPEQARGLAEIDERSDIWSLGVVLFEMLAGRTPFHGESTNDVIASILMRSAPKLSDFWAEAPKELDRIIERALRKEPESRYQKISEFALDLKNLRKEIEYSEQFFRTNDNDQNAQTIVRQNESTRRITDENSLGIAAPRASNWSRILIALGLIGASIFGLWLAFGGRGRDSGNSQSIARLKSEEIVSWSASPGEIYSVGSFSPDGKRIAFTSTQSGTINIWFKPVAGGNPSQVTKDEFGNENPIWSPDGEEIAFFSARGGVPGIWRISYTGGSPKLIAQIQDASSKLGKWFESGNIYFTSKNELFSLNSATGEIKQITAFAAEGIKPIVIAISPDEKSLIYTTSEASNWFIWRRAMDAGSKPLQVVKTNSSIKKAIWHNDGKRVLFSSLAEGTIQIFEADINGGGSSRQITFSEQDSIVLDVSLDGKKILFGSAKEESDIWRASINGSKEETAASDITSELWPNVSPDGKTIAYQSVKNLNQGNKIFNGSILTKPTEADSQPTQLIETGFLPIWSPDGKRLAFMRVKGLQFGIDTVNSSGGDRKVISETGIEPIPNTALPYNKMNTSDIAWSPDSSRIAYLSRIDGSQNLWVGRTDITENLQLTSNTDPKLIINCPLWSPDGTKIAYSSQLMADSGKSAFGVWALDTESRISSEIIRDTSFTRIIGWAGNGEELILAALNASSGSIGLHKEVLLLRVLIKNGEKRSIATLPDTYLYNIHLSPDRKTIAFVSNQDRKDNIWVIPAGGGEAKRITENNDLRLYFSSLAWSPDGKTIYFGKQSRYSLISMLSNLE